MQRMILAVLLFGAAATLGGCNQISSVPYSAPVAAAPSSGGPTMPAPPNWPALPASASCSGPLDDFQKVIWSDVKTGNVNRSVYDSMAADLSRAAGACAAGQDGEALAILRATKAKHGYRA